MAAIRMLGDWLVGQPGPPVEPCRRGAGPKHVVTKGAPPVLSPAEARKLLGSINTDTLAGLRDRALLSVMLYSFARVSAVLGMRRQDYFGQGTEGGSDPTRRGGKRHDIPAHHRAAAALDAYVEAGGLEEPKVALLQTVDPEGRRLPRLLGPAARRSGEPAGVDAVNDSTASAGTGAGHINRFEIQISLPARRAKVLAGGGRRVLRGSLTDDPEPGRGNGRVRGKSASANNYLPTPALRDKLAPFHTI